MDLKKLFWRVGYTTFDTNQSFFNYFENIVYSCHEYIPKKRN